MEWRRDEVFKRWLGSNAASSLAREEKVRGG